MGTVIGKLSGKKISQRGTLGILARPGARAPWLAVFAVAFVIALLGFAGTASALEVTVSGGDADLADYGLETVASELSAQDDGDDPDAWYSSPDGDTYTISNAAEFASFAQIVNGTHATISQDSFEGKTVTLSASILLSEATDLEPVGTEENPFAGTFDGDGNHVWTLRGFSMELESASYVGIFGYVSGTGSLVDVEVDNCSIAITVGESADGQEDPDVVEYVGVLVGYCAGSVVDCSVTASTIDITTSQTPTSDSPYVVCCIGGMAGAVDGDVTGCSFDGTISIQIDSEPAEAGTSIAYSVGESVGGVVGKHGGEPYLYDEDGTQVYNIGHGDISDCTNYGSIYVTCTSTFWSERWYEYYPATVSHVGGIAGTSIGNISGCTNYGNIGFPIADTDSDEPSGSSTRRTGGIVGSWRRISTVDYGTATEDTYGWFDNGLGEEDSAADDIVITDCANYGYVTAYLYAGGVVGAADCKTLITRCSNEGNVAVWRWNSPHAAGIAASSYGDVSYCVNFGEIASKSSDTGGYTSGYYSAGIVSSLSQYQSVDYELGDIPTLTSCYNVGMIRSSGDYKQGAIVGYSEGTVQYCAYLEGCVPDASSRDYVTGGSDGSSASVISCYAYSASDLRTGVVPDSDDDTPSAIALINTLAPDNGWTTYFVPADDESTDYPVLAGSGLECSDPTDLSAAVIELVENAIYSATVSPSPTVTVTLDGVELVQDCDFRVVPDDDATVVGETYSAHIVGIGNYEGTSIATVEYSIEKADLGDTVHSCSIVVNGVYYNWEVQYPTADDITVLDAAGGVIPSDQYEISFPDTSDGAYQDAGTYNVTVTATEDSDSYEGSLTQSAYTIEKGALFSGSADTSHTAVLTSIAWDGDVRYWYTTDENGNYTTGYLDNDEFVYTGSEIKPVADVLTYLGVQLTEGVDYVNIYGNINAEDDEVDGEDADLVNVTDPDDPLVLSIHYKSGSNFSNWINVAYYIVAADLADCTVTATDQPYTGTARDSAVTVALSNGYVLTEGVDYVVTYDDNVSEGTVTYTVTALTQDEGGSGNLTGDPVTGTFEISAGAGVLERVGGTNRYATAALEAIEAFADGCTTAIVASGEKFPDALSATSLAGGLSCPILLTKAASLPEATAAAIEELGVESVIVVGGTGAVSEDVVAALEALGVTVERVSGTNRFETAEAIYEYGLTADDGDSVWGDGIIIASGTDFADALSVSPLAYSQAWPILLAGNNNGIAASLTSASRTIVRDSGVSTAVVVGGTSAVGTAAYSQVSSYIGSTSTVRLAGANRYETSVEVAEWAVEEGYLSWDYAALASGTDFPDALAGSVLQGESGSVLLLVRDGKTSYAEAVLSENTGSIATLRVFGGTGAVPAKVADTLVEALGWTGYTYVLVDE